MEQKEAISITVQIIDKYVTIFGYTGGQYVTLLVYMALQVVENHLSPFISVYTQFQKGLRVISTSTITR